VPNVKKTWKLTRLTMAKTAPVRISFAFTAVLADILFPIPITPKTNESPPNSKENKKLDKLSSIGTRLRVAASVVQKLTRAAYRLTI
jgi:hypothetical protein